MEDVKYAGFWIRFVAYLIDSLVLFGISFIFIIVWAISFGLVAYYVQIEPAQLGFTPAYTGMVIAAACYLLFGFVLPWLYFALQFSSKKQATLGMRAVGVKVVGYDYKRISFGRATGRFFGMILSGIILYIGFIMIAFTKRKQGLHDFIAETYVIRNH